MKKLFSAMLMIVTFQLCATENNVEKSDIESDIECLERAFFEAQTKFFEVQKKRDELLHLELSKLTKKNNDYKAYLLDQKRLLDEEDKALLERLERLERYVEYPFWITTIAACVFGTLLMVNPGTGATVVGPFGMLPIAAVVIVPHIDETKLAAAAA